MEFEDQITYVAIYGNMTIEAVLKMDMISFGLLTESILRTRNAEKMEQAWAAMVSSQGKAKDLKNFTKRWKDNQPGMPGTGQDAKAFQERFGSGI